MVWLKRILSLVLCCTLILACVCVSSGSAEASEDEELFPCVSALDYDTLNSSGLNYGILNSNTNLSGSYKLPFTSSILYVDLILEIQGNVTNINYIAFNSGSTSPLTFSILSSDGGHVTYRAYGTLNKRYSSAIVSFQIVSTNSSVYVSVSRFDVYFNSSPAIGEYGEMRVTPAITQTYAWQTMNMPGSTLGMNLYNWARDGYQAFEAEFSSVNWRKFDYLDFKMQLNVSTIDSIICQIRSSNSSISVPFEISWFTGTAMGNNQFIAHGEMSSQMGQLNATSTFLVTMRVFIPQYARDSGSLIITFNGKYPSSGNSYFVSLQTVTGYYTVDVPDPELVKLDQITAAIEKSLSSSAEDNASAGAFQESMQQQSQSISNNQQILNNVEKPNAAQLGSDFSADAVLNDDGMTLLTTMLTPITQSNLFLGILTLVGTLALVSYVFFGKKK